MTRHRLLPLLLLTLTACGSLASAPSAAGPKSVILIVGDGMGVAHVTAMHTLTGAEFQLTRMPVVGLVETRSTNSPTTDSAAAATAFATGHKTIDRHVGVDPEGKPLLTVLEAAEQAGKTTGVVTTAAFYDATPAAFTAHNKSRYDSADLVRQMLRSGAEVIAGGGSQWFADEKHPKLEDFVKESEFTLITAAADLDSVRAPHILFAYPTQPREVELPEAPLPRLARWAIDRLATDPDGFFLLLENEGIDGASHGNVTDAAQASLRSLNETVRVVLEWAAAHKDVLVIVVGDHETGGLQIQHENGGPFEMVWTTKGHTGELVPLFAFGPGSQAFGGLLDNTDIGRLLLGLMHRPGH